MANDAIIDILINHYSDPRVTINSWGFANCVCGVLREMGLIPSMSDDSVANALGISRSAAFDVIYNAGGRDFIASHPVENKKIVLSMLDNLKRYGEPLWEELTV